MRLSELESKDVIDTKTGKKLGFVTDLEINQECMVVTALLVCEVRWKDFFLVFSKPKTRRICIEQILNIGKDVILVKT